MEPFVFRQCVNILKATGRKANSLRSMRNEIASVRERDYLAVWYCLENRGNSIVEI